MKMVRKRDIYCLNFRIFKKLFVADVAFLKAECFLILSDLRFVSSRDGIKLTVDSILHAGDSASLCNISCT